MYNILIADDEFVERDGIKYLINEYGFPLHIIEAENGRDALSHLKNHKVDILFTVVKMPFIDGLELSKEARRLFPHLKIIIFSGFGEFEYAKTAITLGVVDCLLKPIEEEVFKQLLTRTIHQLNQKSEHAKSQNSSRYIEKQHILLSALNGTSKEVLQSRNLSLDIKFVENFSRLLLLEFDSDLSSVFINTFVAELKAELRREFHYLNLNAYQSMLWFQDGGDFLAIARKVSELIKRAYGQQCYIAFSKEFHGYAAISKEFSLLETCLEERFFFPNTYIFSRDSDMLTEIIDVTENDDTILNNIQSAIKIRDCDAIRRQVMILENKFHRQKQYSYIYVKFIFSSILREFYQKISTFKESNLNSGIEDIYRTTSLSDVSEIVNQAIDTFEKNFDHTDSTQHEVELIQKYIFENYDKVLSVSDLAAHVFLTPNYLSYVFKKDTGIGVNKFIKNYRMEKAKQFLEDTNIKVVKVCQMVGYANVSYFRQSFREFYGINPEKFRLKEDE